jgi:hypothetical protein
MYTEGIRKIFFVNKIVNGIDDVASMAEKAGFAALNYNGTIHVKYGGCWHPTVFQTSDFKTH